jgi:hypothetical protein
VKFDVYDLSVLERLFVCVLRDFHFRNAEIRFHALFTVGFDRKGITSFWSVAESSRIIFI